MLLILVLKPNASSRRAPLPAEPLGTFIAPSAPITLPWPLSRARDPRARAAVVVRNGYVLQTLGVGWLYAILAIA